MSDSDNECVKELFNSCDLDSSGFIDRAELAAVVDLDDEKLDVIFKQLDKDGDGRISIEEFTENYRKCKCIASQVEQRKGQGHSDQEHSHSGNSPDISSNNSPEKHGKPIYKANSFIRAHDTGAKMYRRKKPWKKVLNQGQDHLEDVYTALENSDNPGLLQSLEKFVAATVDSVQQKQSENEKLDSALRRASEKNSELARSLEEEMEQQICTLQEKIREEEKKRAEKYIEEAMYAIQSKDREIASISEKVAVLETALKDEPNKSQDIAKEIESKQEENEVLNSQLREYQTQLALLRSEVSHIRGEYDEQGSRLVKERSTVLQCVSEQENLTRQLQLLHEANRRLHDTNDDLRSALETKRQSQKSNNSSRSSSPMKSFSTPYGIYRRSSNQSFTRGESLDHSMDSPVIENHHSRPVEAVNEISLLSELAAADDEDMSVLSGDQEDQEGVLNESMSLPDGVLPSNSLETDYVDSDADKDLPSFIDANDLEELFRDLSRSFEEDDEAYNSMPKSERQQFVKQLQILFDTNKRLSKSNDELRAALSIIRKNTRKRPKRRTSKLVRGSSTHSDYASGPGSETEISRKQSPHSRGTPKGTSSPLRSSKREKNSSVSSTSQEDSSITEVSYANIEDSMTTPETLYDSHELTIQPEEQQQQHNQPFIDDTVIPSENEHDIESFDDIIIPKLQEQTLETFSSNTSIVTRNVSIQCDVKNINSQQHICINDNCDCSRELSSPPLDKSTQISDHLLNTSLNEVIIKTPIKETSNICKVCETPVNIEMDGIAMCECTRQLLLTGIDQYDSDDDDESLTEDTQHVFEDEIVTAKQPSMQEIVTNSNPTTRHSKTNGGVSSSTSNYTEQESISNSNASLPYSDTSDSAPLRHRDQSESIRSSDTSGVNSSYSVLQNLETELSMYAKRDPDEEYDEDDMEEDELVRLVDMTTGSDSESEHGNNKTVEEREPAVGADAYNGITPAPIESKPERMYKLVLAGDAAVGKSSFILRLCKNKFYQSLNSTLGVDFQMKTMLVDGHTVALQLWDTAGQERFRSIARSYFRKVDGVLLLYDVTCETSFKDVRNWIESVEDGSSRPVPIIICGNKVDLRASAVAKGKRVISRKQGESLAKEFGALFIETSAKEGSNIEGACLELARQLWRLEDQEVKQGGIDLNEGNRNSEKNKSRCCR